MTQKLILSLIGQNENQVLFHAAEGLGSFFAFHGYQHQVLDLRQPDAARTLLMALQSGEVYFAYSLAGVGAQLTMEDGTCLWTAAKTPFVAFWYDHPAYNYRQHIVASPYILNCYHVRDHLAARQQWLPATNHAIYLPPPYGPNPLARSRGWDERSRIFMFAKTAYDPRQIRADWRNFPPQLQQLLETLSVKAVADRDLDLATATATALQTINYPLDNLNAFMGVVQEVDHYVRAWRSDRLARALASYPHFLFGRGWDYLASQDQRVMIQPAFPGDALLQKIMDYRLVANSSPLWRHGIHERAVTGLASGCVTLTDRSQRSDALLNGLPNYVGFEWTDDSLAEAVAKAWDLSGDGAEDFVTPAEQLFTPMLYSESNFLQPLRDALRALVDQLN